MKKIKAIFAVAAIATVFTFASPASSGLAAGDTTDVWYGCPECNM